MKLIVDGAFDEFVRWWLGASRMLPIATSPDRQHIIIYSSSMFLSKYQKKVEQKRIRKESLQSIEGRKKERTNVNPLWEGFLPFSSITFASLHTGARSVHVLAAAGQRDLLYPLADGILLARWKRRLKPIGTLFPFRGCVCGL